MDRSARLRLRLILCVACMLAIVLAPASAAARSHAGRPHGPVPPGFVGVDAGGPLLGSGVNSAAQFYLMASSGVESVRMVFNWAAAQPYSSWDHVPLEDAGKFTDVGGVPTNFSQTDQIVALAAQHRLSLLPVVLYTPSWDEAPHPRGTFGIPASNAPYADYLTALIARYGPQGSFWLSHSPWVPIRAWQIWNEPNISVFWPRQPFARTYVQLLSAAHAAIKSADPQAKVVLAGLPNYSWFALSGIYAIRGAWGLFDVVAVHPYTRRPKGVITVLRRVRRVMNRAGDVRKSILADEISWPSSLGRTRVTDGLNIATTEAGQARNLSILLPMLGADRVKLGLSGFDYYTWAGTEDRRATSFDYAGLLRFNSGTFVAKPALFAFRHAALTLESCRAKANVATVCLSHG